MHVNGKGLRKVQLSWLSRETNVGVTIRRERSVPKTQAIERPTNVGVLPAMKVTEAYVGMVAHHVYFWAWPMVAGLLPIA